MPTVQLVFGPMLIGAFVNAILYGIMIVQMFLYYQVYKKDSWMRHFVLFLFVVETINTAFTIFTVYQPLILQYGTFSALSPFPMLLSADPLLTVVISTPIQIFIAWRIKIISRATWLAAVICILSLVSLGGGVWLTATVIRVHRYARKPELHWPALMWLLASAIADVTITISLCFNLARQRSGLSGTDNAINKIIRLTIQTGFITTIFAILDVLCFLTMPHTTINLVWDFSLSKLYTNALMSTLNARTEWGSLLNGGIGSNVLFGDNSNSRVPKFDTNTVANFRMPQMMSTGAYGLTPSLCEADKNISHAAFGTAARESSATDSPAKDNPAH